MRSLRQGICLLLRGYGPIFGLGQLVRSQVYLIKPCCNWVAWFLINCMKRKEKKGEKKCISNGNTKKRRRAAQEAFGCFLSCLWRLKKRLEYFYLFSKRSHLLTSLPYIFISFVNFIVLKFIFHFFKYFLFTILFLIFFILFNLNSSQHLYLFIFGYY